MSGAHQHPQKRRGLSCEVTSHMFSIRIFHMLPFVDAFSSHLNGPIAKNVHAPLSGALPLQQLRKEMMEKCESLASPSSCAPMGLALLRHGYGFVKGSLQVARELQGLCSPPPSSARSWMPGPMSSAQKVVKKPRNCSSH